MKLEDQVTSLEISKRLKELGAKQESLFYWCYWLKEQKDINAPWEQWYVRMENTGYVDHAIKDGAPSAFTVAELDEILSKIEYESMGFPSYMVFYAMGTWHSLFRNPPLKWIETGSQNAGVDDNPADARGKMLIYLIENNLLEAKQ